MIRVPETSRPAVFLDRDGTLMQDVDYCGDPKQVNVFPNVAGPLRRLKEHGYKIIVITNQSGIGRGYFTQRTYYTIERELERQLGEGILDATYFCADLPECASDRRKPNAGMLLEAERDFDLDLARSFMVGDKCSDIESGETAGVRTILVKTGYGKDATNCSPDFVASDLSEAAEIILKLGHG